MMKKVACDPSTDPKTGVSVRGENKNKERSMGWAPGLKFKIVERGGTMVEWDLQKSNPTATGGFQSGDCPACKEGSGKGGPRSLPASNAQLTARLSSLEKQPKSMQQWPRAQQQLSEKAARVIVNQTK